MDHDRPDLDGTVSVPAAPSAPLAPVAAAERLETLDLLRGIAILGILLVNMQMFFQPMYRAMVGPPDWHSAIDRVVEGAIHLLAQGKFYAMFSFLFGMGMAIQLDRAAARGVAFGAFFARRMGWLLAIGLVHAVLVWYGDILVLYALLGFALILFRRLSLRALLIWIGVLLLFPIVLTGSFSALMELLRLFPEPWAEVEREIAASRETTVELLDRALDVYARGSYGEILLMRLRQLGTMYTFVPFMVAPQILGLFLTGLVAGRLRVFQEPDRFRPHLRRWLPWLALSGLGLSTLSLVAMRSADPMLPSWWMLAQNVGFMLGGPTLCFAYVAGITLLAADPRWMARLRPIGFVGRMALTNYVLHSLVFTTLANSYGGGLYGSLPPAIGLGMTTAMFLLQIPLSRFWLQRYRFGPLEWLWRSLTYHELQPMRRAA